MCRLVETAELLCGTAFLADGGIPEDPAKFADYSRTAWLALCTTRDPSPSSSEAPLDHSVTAVKARLERGRG